MTIGKETIVYEHEIPEQEMRKREQQKSRSGIKVEPVAKETVYQAPVINVSPTVTSTVAETKALPYVQPKEMSRRKFLKIGAVGGVAAIAALALKSQITGVFGPPIKEIEVGDKGYGGMDSSKPPEMYVITSQDSGVLFLTTLEPSARILYKGKYIGMEEFSKMFKGGDKLGGVFTEGPKTVAFGNVIAKKTLNELMYVKKVAPNNLNVEFNAEGIEYWGDSYEYEYNETVTLEAIGLPDNLEWDDIDPNVIINGRDRFGFRERTYYEGAPLKSKDADSKISNGDKIKARCRVESADGKTYYLLMQELLSIE